MAVYEFECPAGHVTELHVSLQDRPATITCEHAVPSLGGPGTSNDLCGQEAKFVLSATPTTFRAQDRKAFKRQGH